MKRERALQHRRERVVTPEEESRYLMLASA